MKRLFMKHFSWWTRKLDQDAVDSCAAQASFWMLIAVIPFVLLVLTLLRSIRFQNVSLLFLLADLLPGPVREMLRYLLSGLHTPPGLLSVTALLCVWSASNGMLALVKGLYAVFDVSRRHNFIRMRLLAVLYTLAFTAVLLISLVLLVFSDRLYTALRLPPLPPATKPVFSFLALLFLFWLMFIAIPRKQVKFRFALLGAAFSAAGWLLFSFFFSIFVENFSNYATLYGGLAAVVILMMWLYICMYILLIGGEVAMWLQRSPVRQDLRSLYSARRRQTAAQKGLDHGKNPTQKH